MHLEVREASRARLEEFETIVSFGQRSVGKDAPMHARQNRCKRRVVDAGRNSAVKRDLVHESEKGMLHVVHVAVAVHVLTIEVCHHGKNRRQLQE